MQVSARRAPGRKNARRLSEPRCRVAIPPIAHDHGFRQRSSRRLGPSLARLSPRPGHRSTSRSKFCLRLSTEREAEHLQECSRHGRSPVHRPARRSVPAEGQLRVPLLGPGKAPGSPSTEPTPRHTCQPDRRPKFTPLSEEPEPSTAAIMRSIGASPGSRGLRHRKAFVLTGICQSRRAFSGRASTTWAICPGSIRWSRTRITARTT